MDVVKSLIEFLAVKGRGEKSLVPEGFCPNCWGREEYGGHFYERVKRENLNINSKEANVGWVSAYANKYLTGIALQRKGSGGEMICSKCRVSFEQSHSK